MWVKRNIVQFRAFVVQSYTYVVMPYATCSLIPTQYICSQVSQIHPLYLLLLLVVSNDFKTKDQKRKKKEGKKEIAHTVI